MACSSAFPGVPDAQRDPVLRRYPLRRRRLPIAGKTVSLVVPDERVHRRGGGWCATVLRGGEPPYWVRIWPAAVAAAGQLVRAGHGLAGLRVLDLGCGLGLPGVLAASLGAHVVFADREPDALRFAVWNARAQVPAAAGDRISAQQLDWAQGDVNGRFDLIVLSDVTYHASHHAGVLRQLHAALAPSGAVLHADPFRALATVFLGRLADRFVACALRRRTVAPEHADDVRLLLATPSSATVGASAAALQQWRQRLCFEATGNAAAIAVPFAGDPVAPSDVWRPEEGA